MKGGSKPKQIPRVMRVRDVRELAQDDEEMRDFLEGLRDAEPSAMNPQFEAFVNSAEGRNTLYRRNKFFFGDGRTSGWMSSLPTDAYDSFINAYLEQENKDYIGFWEQYQELPEVEILIEERAAEDKRLAQVLEGLDEAVINEAKGGAPKKPRRNDYDDEQEYETDLEEYQELLRAFQALVSAERQHRDEEEATRRLKARLARELRKKQREEEGGQKPPPRRETVIMTDEEIDRLLRERGEGPLESPMVRPVRPSLGPSSQQPKLSRCALEKRQAPWLDARVKTVLIAPASKGEAGLVEEAFSVDGEGTELEVDGVNHQFHRARRAFFEMLCSERSEQVGSVLRVALADRTVLGFHIAYVTNKEIIYQDERIFELEKKYDEQKHATRAKRLQLFLRDPVSSQVTDFAERRLQAVLQGIAPKGGYGEGAFAKDVVSDLKESSGAGPEMTTKNFLRKLAELLVYLSYAEPDGPALGLRANLQDRTYTAATLASSGLTELLPEIAEEGEQGRGNQEIISTRITRTERNLANTAYQMAHATQRIPTQPSGHQFLRKLTLKWSQKCSNSDAIAAARGSAQSRGTTIRLVPYAEDDELYCLTEDDVKGILEGRIGTNPYTNNELDPDFIATVNKANEGLSFNWDLFSQTVRPTEDGWVNVSLSEPVEVIPPPEVPVTQPQGPDLAPDLLNWATEILKDCDATSSFPDPDSESESSESESSESESSESESADSDSEPSPDPVENKNSSFSGGVKCETCGKGLDPAVAYKTKKAKGKDYVTQYYCPGEKCMSKGKFHPLKPKGRTSKRRGRNSVKERKVQKNSEKS